MCAVAIAEEGFKIWSPAETLSPRVKRLRDEYFNYDGRDYFRNETIPYSTGTDWDSVYTPTNGRSSRSLSRFSPRSRIPSWPSPARFLFPKISGMSHRRPPCTLLPGGFEAPSGGHFWRESSSWGATFPPPFQLPERERERRMAEERILLFPEGEVAHRTWSPQLRCDPGHIIPNHVRILQEGFAGVQKRAESFLTETHGDKKKDFLRAVIHCCEGVRLFAERYAQKAEQLAAQEEEQGRREELRNIAAICRRVPYYPARTFHEALQSVWFQHMLILMAESYPGPGVSYGRFDQYMHTYYARDLQEGHITREEGKELLRCFWVKNNYAYDFFGTSGGRQGITAATAS